MCEYTIKRIRKVSDKRNDPAILTARERFAEEMQEPGELENYRKKTIFIDEARFNLHLIRELSVLVTEPNQALAAETRGSDEPGEIGDDGETVVDVPRGHGRDRGRHGGNVSQPQVAEDGIAASSTTDAYFGEFIEEILGVLERKEMYGYTFLMDDTTMLYLRLSPDRVQTFSIHKSPQTRELIEEVGYSCKYLPPYPPFLNPIEECWLKIKSTFKRNSPGTKMNLCVPGSWTLSGR
ncbi:hypothetical protein BGX21_003886 [Mortierella sp. AD011]|nr:hypothetical protein BGX21_003886 [Mortierella sp. AD011]